MIDLLLPLISWGCSCEDAAWHIFGIGIGQAEILKYGITAGTIGIVGYRFHSRGKRYGK